MYYRLFQLFVQIDQAHNHYKTSWTAEDAEKSTKCATDVSGMSQASADFSNCVDGSVVSNYGTPYDFESMMHYGLDE